MEKEKQKQKQKQKEEEEKRQKEEEEKNRRLEDQKKKEEEAAERNGKIIVEEADKKENQNILEEVYNDIKGQNEKNEDANEFTLLDNNGQDEDEDNLGNLNINNIKNEKKKEDKAEKVPNQASILKKRNTLNEEDLSRSQKINTGNNNDNSLQDLRRSDKIKNWKIENLYY